MSRLHRIAPIPVALTLAATSGLLASAPARGATPDPNPSPLELAHQQLARTAATQGMVLLENHRGALPLPKKGNVALFGVGTVLTVPGGTGSGQVNNRHTVTVKEGFEKAGYTVTTPAAYLDAVTSAYYAKYPNALKTPIRPTVDYAALEQPLSAATVTATAPTTTAVVTVTRDSGEGADRSQGKGDYLLSDVELANLKLVASTYRRVVVVLNVGGIVDTTAYKELNAQLKDPQGGLAIDALLVMSQAGEESGNALVDVLNGTVDPSGKLSDTWASKYSYYPASATFAKNDGNSTLENYSEGVYVGYRYFDTFYRRINRAAPASVVNYAFGQGLSYTTFDVRAEKVTADAEHVTVTARVRNTGQRYSGKQVVQVYFSAPTGRIDKPYQQLAGYVKTDELAPGASQRVTVTFRTADMASYDETRHAWVLDAGDYAIRVGDSSRNTHVAAKVRIRHRATVSTVHSELVDDQQPANEMVGSSAYFYTYRGERQELRRARVLAVDTTRMARRQDASRYEQTVPVAPTSAQYPLDGALMSSTTAYVDAAQTDWEGTGAPYQAKTGETVKAVRTTPGATLYDVRAGRLSMEQFVAGLSLQQLADIVEGTNKAGSTRTAVGAAGYTTPLYESKGIPGMTLADGPAGLRITQQVTKDGQTTYQYATAFPVGTLLAQTWDRDVVTAVGTAVGQEMVEQGATLWLAPGMNIHRDPLNGRNFEYYSEDPLVSGTMGAAMTRGVQSNPGVGVTIKHFVANNQETDRFTVNTVISERALREVYLKGFEIAVKSAQPMALMNSYNYVNGTYATADHDLNVDVLRGEWGFKGLVMTDWGAGPRAGAANTLYGGTDLIEPGNYSPEVVNVIKKTAPDVDVSGLPFYNQTWSILYLIYRYTWNTGSMTLDPTGDATTVTRVDQNTDLSHPRSMITTLDAIQNPTYQQHPAFVSVDEAYREVQHYLAADNTALSATQKAAITVSDVVHQDANDPSSPVTAYTVTLRGTYPKAGYPMRLGDLQRAAMQVLATTMQTQPFAELARIQGVGGVEVSPYSDQFDDLVTVLGSTKGAVRGR